MLRVTTQRYPATNGHRAEIVSSVVAACDLCGTACEESRQWSDMQFEQGLAHEHAKRLGWIERYKGRLQQLICPSCQKDEQTT